MRFAPYAGLGILIFSLNSGSELNYFLRGYSVILQAQAGIVLLYLEMSKFRKNPNKWVKISKIADRDSEMSIAKVKLKNWEREKW